MSSTNHRDILTNELLGSQTNLVDRQRFMAPNVGFSYEINPGLNNTANVNNVFLSGNRQNQFGDGRVGDSRTNQWLNDLGFTDRLCIRVNGGRSITFNASSGTTSTPAPATFGTVFTYTTNGGGTLTLSGQINGTNRWIEYRNASPNWVSEWVENSRDANFIVMYDQARNMSLSVGIREWFFWQHPDSTAWSTLGSGSWR